HPPRRADNPARDLAAIGDQDLFEHDKSSSPVAGLVPATHVLVPARIPKAWMPGTSPGKGFCFDWMLTASSQRDVVVLLPRVFEPLAAQHVERAAEAPPRRAGLDDVVDKAAARRDKRVRISRGIPRCAPRSRRRPRGRPGR